MPKISRKTNHVDKGVGSQDPSHNENLVLELTLLAVYLMRRMKKYEEFDGVITSAKEFMRRRGIDPLVVRPIDVRMLREPQKSPYGWTILGTDTIYIGPHGKDQAENFLASSGEEGQVIPLYRD